MSEHKTFSVLLGLRVDDSYFEYVPKQLFRFVASDGFGVIYSDNVGIDQWSADRWGGGGTIGMESFLIDEE